MRRGLLNPLKSMVLHRLLRPALNNPDYVGAVAMSYAVLASQIVIQILLVPFYISMLGKPRFGVLMIILSMVAIGSVGLSMMRGRFVRLLSEKLIAGGWPAAAGWQFTIRVILGFYGFVIGGVIVFLGLVAPTRIFGSEFEILSRDVMVAVLVAGLYPVLLSQLSAENLLLSAVRKQKWAHLFLVLNNVIFAVSVVMALSYGMGLTGVMSSFVLSVSIVWLVARWRLHHVFGPAAPVPTLCLLWERIVDLFDGLWCRYAVIGILFALLQADTVIVGALGGATAAAEFVLVWKVAEVAVLLLWRISDNLQPEIIHMQLRGEGTRLERVFGNGLNLVWVISLVAGVGYALAGSWAVRLWVGADAAPHNPLAYALAGGAIFWLGSARFPIAITCALARLDNLIKAVAAEVTLKWLIAFILFPVIGYAGLLGAINILHVCGLAFIYVALARRELRAVVLAGEKI